MSDIQECVQQIQSAFQQLRSLVYGCSTSDVAGHCFAFHLRQGNDPEFDTGLSAPAKQCSFLLGLLLESPEPDAPKSFSEEDGFPGEFAKFCTVG